MEDITPRHRQSLDIIAQLRSSIDRDSLCLTRDDRDMLSAELDAFTKKLNDIYRKRTHADG